MSARNQLLFEDQFYLVDSHDVGPKARNSIAGYAAPHKLMLVTARVMSNEDNQDEAIELVLIIQKILGYRAWNHRPIILDAIQNAMQRVHENWRTADGVGWGYNYYKVTTVIGEELEEHPTVFDMIEIKDKRKDYVL